MGKREYEWSPGGSPPVLGAHSHAKHNVLREYLAQYIRVRTGLPQMDRFRLTLVDGFAGGGLYRTADTGKERLGSPLLMVETMAEAQAEAQIRRKKPFTLDVNYVFIDAEPAAIRCLKANLTMRGYLPRLASQVQVMEGRFENQAHGVIKAIRSQKGERVHHAIFVLDQYGYTDVPFSVLRQIFTELPHAEVILTFATDWLINYLADTVGVRSSLGRLGDPALADAILAASNDTAEGRRLIQCLLHESIYRSSGAAFYTPFFITSRESNRSYWLLHLSGHARARDVMTDLHWTFANHFEHYGRPGTGMLGFDPARPDPGVQLGFFFDRSARQRTIEALQAELTTRIWHYRDGVTITDLYRQIANETPASSAVLKEALVGLAKAGEVELRGPEGGEKRVERLDGDDRVIASRQIPLLVRQR